MNRLPPYGLEAPTAPTVKQSLMEYKTPKLFATRCSRLHRAAVVVLFVVIEHFVTILSTELPDSATTRVN